MELGGRGVSGTWFRCVSLRRDPLSTVWSEIAGGRFNDVGTGALYLAGTPAVAVAEHLRLGGLFGVASFPPRMLVTVEVVLSNVVDLVAAGAYATYGLETTDLNADWRGVADSATQALGRSLRAAGVEAVVFASVVEPRVGNLAVFTENLLPTSRLAVVGLGSD
jgi:RES domain-containing protein